MRHPLVAEISRWERLAIAGRPRVLQVPKHYDFQDLRLTPAAARDRLERLGYANVVAFNTRNPMHRIHEELTKRAVQEIDGALLLHPVVGLTKPGDIDHYTRVRTYKALVANHYDASRTLVIDPTLTYVAFLGGTGYDTAEGIAVDSSGNAYITGWTGSTDFPTTAGALDQTYNTGNYDIYIAKLNASGTALVYSTFIGGSGDDMGSAITVDSSGNVYIAGQTTSTNLPTVNA